MMNQFGPLGASFQVVRIFQAMCLVAIVGMSANFVSMMVNAGTNPSGMLVAVLVVSIVAVLYCVVTFLLHLNNSDPPFLTNAVADTLLMVALIVVSVLIGQPLSYLNCSIISNASNRVSVSAYASNLASFLEKFGTSYGYFLTRSKAVCLEMKAIWGLSIALCIFFSFSAVVSLCLWRNKKKTAGGKADA
ncbi:hypothetical protein VTN49DRAFT_6277 [Thermomyces lanuginosus]|uniref:uncharacterized protein n=1 Tax=Thermomyces lanuginosus TaxID=5541 RepID=UPI003744154A